MCQVNVECQLMLDRGICRCTRDLKGVLLYTEDWESTAEKEKGNLIVLWGECEHIERQRRRQGTWLYYEGNVNILRGREGERKLDCIMRGMWTYWEAEKETGNLIVLWGECEHIKRQRRRQETWLYWEGNVNILRGREGDRKLDCIMRGMWTY